MNSRVLAIALAAVLVLAAVPLGASVWADDDKERKAKDKIAIKENKQARFDDDDDERASASLGSLKATGKGIAVVKSPGSVKTSDATVDLSGTVLKDAGKNAKVSVNGTVAYGGEQWKVRAEGKVKAQSQSDLGRFQLHGKLFKDDERGQMNFRLNAILLPAQDENTWKFVGESPVIVGRHARIYALTGELDLDRTQPAPQPAPGDLDHFVITPIGNQVAGTEFTFKVTAVDDDGDVKTNYNGTVTISTNAGTSASGQAPTVTQSSYTFTASDAGQHVFAAKMFKAEGNVTLTVAGSGKTATSNAFEVKPAAVSSVTISPAGATLNAGASATFNAAAKDAYGNSITGAAYVWALGTPSLGTLVVSSDTASVLFTAAGVSAASSSALSVIATHGGASASSSVTVTVNPA
ncbi:hypothetical protein [Nitrososphaera sp.]|uniref:hypothetical protein n=1 Tax=Nitrososphaera sp. TaxID=1971748 RepID=UPI00316BFF4B